MSRRGATLPLDQRIRLHREVRRLRKLGLSYNGIIERIQKSYGVRLSTSHISFWIRGIHEPLGSVNKFNGEPTPELAGIIGALLSDGNLHVSSNRYGIQLRVNDKEFAKAFGSDLAKVLGRRRPYEPYWSQGERRWIVEAKSILLFKALDKPWQELRPHIEHCKECVARYLRMFSDGEGSITGRALTILNTERELLLYHRRLMQKYFGIESTGPRPNSPKPGQTFRNPRNGKISRVRKMCYKIYIRVRSLPMFHRYIGFTIRRKQERLEEAILR